jgi:hypothetical protein
MLAYIEKQTSQGVLVELGWASALRKPILLFTPRRSNVPLIIQGIDKTLCSLKIIQARSAEQIVACAKRVLRG